MEFTSSAPLLKCRFTKDDFCGFESLQTQEEFYWGYSEHLNAMKTVHTSGGRRLPWNNEAYLYSPLMTAPRSSRSPCLKTSFRHQR
jgi:hypothetical protein